MFDKKHTTMVLIPDGLAGVPVGQKVYPIKRHCRIKSSGEFKIRYVALGNFDDYDGVTFSPTAAKKVIWLVFAITILLNLLQRFLDIKGAFMAERPTRDIYVSLDGKVYLLKYNLYGLKDAAKVFNDGLTQHLLAGGYTQSKWDLCLFYKWQSVSSFIILVFHVDDFSANSSQAILLDEFEQHMKAKYDVKSNTDGIFLGIHLTKLLCANDY